MTPKGNEAMTCYDFVVVLKGLEVIDDDLAEALYEAGCDDGSPYSSGGVAGVGFSREADCLESAIRSAVADVRRAGCTVQRIEIESDSPLVAG
jgi:hypothetical protein